MTHCCLCLLMIAAWLSPGALCAAQPADRARADSEALHSLRREWLAGKDTASDQFLRRFSEHSERVAKARGPLILYTLFREARQWKHEEIIMYLSLIFQLERRQTLQILHSYARSHPDAQEFVQYLLNEIRQHDQSVKTRQSSNQALQPTAPLRYAFDVDLS